MLAYVFWHWTTSQQDTTAYQEALRDFQAVLAEQKSSGFRYSRVLKARQTPWSDTQNPAYEDWYVLENSAALDPLDLQAVSGACREPHNKAARLAAGGTGGLYRLRFGESELPSVRFVYWFHKPAHLPYAQIYANLQPIVQEAKGTLWVRQMTMGPAREFCLHSPNELQLPEDFQALSLPVEQIWSSLS